ncbi:MAG TPA: anti-sigma factor [Polyangia bacterium]|jgi:anti-sigma factor RsiW
MTTLDHEQTQERFDPYREGDLPDEERRAVAAHLAECAPCREAYERFLGAMSLLATLPPKAAPDNFVDKVKGQIRTRSKGRFFAGGPIDWSSRLPYEVLSVVMLIAIVAIFLFIFLGRGGGAAISH